MVLLYLPGGPASQLSSFFFFASALVSDVLLIRLSLVLAYCWLLVAAALGMPKWPSMEPSGGLALDTLIWAAISLLFHANAFFRLLFDERPIRFESDDHDQLWRFFMRRSGMPRLEAAQVLRQGEWRRVPAGRTIVSGPEVATRFFVLVEGLASLERQHRGVLAEPRLQYSGCCFDLSMFSIFGIYTSFEKAPEHLLSAVAVTDCLLYSWSLDELSTMATHMAPAVGAYWRYFALCQLGLYFGYRTHPEQRLVCATGEPEDEGVMKGGRSRDFTHPLRSYEDQHHTLRGAWALLKRSLHPFPPPGLRHSSLPITGIMARNRLIALKAAKAMAAIQKERSASGHSPQESVSAGASGARLAYKYLSALQSYRRLDAISIDRLLEEVAATGRLGGRPSAGAASVILELSSDGSGGSPSHCSGSKMPDGEKNGGGGGGSKPEASSAQQQRNGRDSAAPPPPPLPRPASSGQAAELARQGSGAGEPPARPGSIGRAASDRLLSDVVW